MEKKKLLISLVSKQTIPNILLIKELKPDMNYFLLQQKKWKRKM